MKPTFQLHYKTPTLLAVKCYGEEVLTFREGLYDLTAKNRDNQSHLNDQAEKWLTETPLVQLLVCNIDARRHLVWSLNREWHWQAILTAIRHGYHLGGEVFQNGDVTFKQIIQHPDIMRQAYLDTLNAYDIEELELDEDHDHLELFDKIAELKDDEITELTRTILFSFTEYCNIEYPDRAEMSDAAFADLVIEPWARDFLWWPAYVNNHPRVIAGNTIFHARMAKGWTEEELAKRAGITPANVRNIERGRYDMKIDTIFAIAHALGISITIEADIQHD